MVEVWETEEPGKVARDGIGLPLGTVRGGLAWRTWILPAAGPSSPTPPLTHMHPNSTISKQNALGTGNSEAVMSLVEFLAFPLDSCIPRQMVELS